MLKASWIGSEQWSVWVGRWLAFLAAVGLCGMAAFSGVVPSFFGGGNDVGSSGLSMPYSPVLQVPMTRREHWLESPVEHAQRVASRMAFHGLSAGAARGLLVGDYGSVLAGVGANPAARVARAGRVVRYLGAYRAVVRGPRGLGVVSSSTPLLVGGAKTGRPVDLGLRRVGSGFAPVAPLVGVSVARDAAGGVAVGGSGSRLTLEGRNVSGSMVAGKGVFFPSVGRDMDASVVPTVDGVDLFAVLRSRLSPEQIRYRVALPAGAVLVTMGSGVVVSRDGRALMRIQAPSARDAQGAMVPVTMRASGDELIVGVPHRKADVAYPILVDPDVTVELHGTGGGWSFVSIPNKEVFP